MAKIGNLTAVIAILLVLIGIFTMVKVSSYYAPTAFQSAQTNLSINTTCSLSLNTTNLTYGQTNPNTTYSAVNISVNFSNGGNFEQNVSINATPWFINDSVTTANASTLGCNQTRYSNNSSTSGLTPLTWEAIGSEGRGICGGSTIQAGATAGTINRVQPNQSFVGAGGGSRGDNNTTFRINVPAGTVPGRYTQNITYIAEC